MSGRQQTFEGAKFCALCRKVFDIRDASDRCPLDANQLTVVRRSPFADVGAGDSFEILSLLGVGGWGIVYKARQKAFDRFVAVKTLHPHLLTRPDIARRFSQEAELVSRLNHPNIIATIDYGLLADGVPYLIMEYVPGLNLDELLADEGPLSPQLACEIVRRICDGLAAAHAQKIIHRDLKPSNVRVSGFGTDNMTVKVMDFGLAKVAEESGLSANRLTMTGFTIGTPAYMSPELCKAEQLDERSDIYSLGCIMYELLTGRLAIRGANAFETMRGHLTRTPESFQSCGVDVPASLQTVVWEAMSKSRNDRYSSVEELKHALGACFGGAAGAPVVSHSGRRLVEKLPWLAKTVWHEIFNLPSILGRNSGGRSSEAPPAEQVDTETREDGEDAATVVAPAVPGPVGHGSLPRAPILVVEPDESDRKLAVLQLQILGLSADAVASADQALAAIEAHNYAAVLVNCHAGDVGASNLHSRLPDLIKTKAKPPLLIAILQQGGADVSPDGYDDCLRKPLAPSEIRRTLRRTLTAARPASQRASEDASGAAGVALTYENATNNAEDTLALLVEFDDTMVLDSRFEETAPLQPAAGDPVNMDTLQQTYGAETAQELLTVFMATATRLLDLIDDARRRKRATALQLLAHQLKGSASAVGASEITRLSGAMETAAARADFLQVRVIYEGLKFSIAKLARFVGQKR